NQVLGRNPRSAQLRDMIAMPLLARICGHPPPVAPDLTVVLPLLVAEPALEVMPLRLHAVLVHNRLGGDVLPVVERLLLATVRTLHEPLPLVRELPLLVRTNVRSRWVREPPLRLVL